MVVRPRVGISRCLLGDEYHSCARLAQRRGDGKQERTTARNHDALPAHDHPRLQQGLRATDSDDCGQRPPGKGQESLARTRREEQPIRAQLDEHASLLDTQHEPFMIIAVRVYHGSATAHDGARACEPFDPTPRRAARRLTEAWAPDLSADTRALVDDDDTCPRLGGTCGGGDSGGACADDGDVGFRHVDNRRHSPEPPLVRTIIPSATGTRHARWCATPSIVTRHS